MKCRIALVALILLSGVFAFSGSEAAADPPTAASVVEAPGSWDPIEELLTGKITSGGGLPGAMADAEQLYDAAGGAGGTYNTARAKLIVGQITEAADVAGVGGLGVAGVLPIFAEGAGAFAVGWTTGSALDHWLGISDYFGPAPDAPPAEYSTDADWLYGDCQNIAVGSGFTGAFVPGAASTNYGNKYTTANMDAACTNVDVALSVAPGTQVRGWLGLFKRTTGTWDSNYCNATIGGGNQDSIMRTMMVSLTATLGGTSVDIPNLGGCAPGYRGAMWMTPGQMTKLRAPVGGVKVVDPGGSQVTVPRPTKIETAADDCVYGSDCFHQIIDYLNGTGTAARDWIVHELDPSVVPDDPAELPPFTIPVPNPNESYDDYAGRLVAGGYLGTITRVDETSPLEGYGPESPTRISYHPRNAPTTLKVVDPLNWPSPGPNIAPDSDISIRVNPDDVPPVGDAGGGGSCSCPPLDFSPLQGLDVGNSFPFGALNWFKDAMGTPSASNLDFTLHLPIGDQDINTESAWWEDNRDTYYPIEEFLITVAFFFVFATRILHLGKADED
jgi:hypothetical protein